MIIGEHLCGTSVPSERLFSTAEHRITIYDKNHNGKCSFLYKDVGPGAINPPPTPALPLLAGGCLPPPLFSVSWGDTQIKECKEVIINPLSHPPLKIKQNSGFSQAKPVSKLQFAGLNRVIALT